MCLEDLRLGRGRVLGKSVVITGSTDSALQANSSRVAVILSSTLLMYFDTGAVTAVSDSAFISFGPTNNGQRVIAMNAGTSLFVLRIEDIGNAIAGPISVLIGNSSGIATVTLTEIYTEVNAPPLDTYKP